MSGLQGPVVLKKRFLDVLIMVSIARISRLVKFMGVSINTFVHAGGFIPGGFTGMTLPIQEICIRYGNIW
jgi:hypothetical protein